MKPLFRRVVLWALVALGAWAGLVRADRNDVGEPRVLHGPMVGAIESDIIRIWARVPGDRTVAVEFWKDVFLSESRRSEMVEAKEDQDYSVVFELVSVCGDSVWDGAELRASDLQNGVESWKRFSSRKLKERYDREYANT